MQEPPPLALDAVALAAPDVNRRKDQHKLHFGLRQMVRNTWSVWLIALFITMPAWRVTSPWLWLGWLVATGVAFELRARYLRAGRELAAVQADPEGWARRLWTTTLGVGAIAAVGPLLLYPALDDVARMYICMLYCCWLAGAMSSLGALPRLFAVYAIVFMAGVGAAWLRSDSDYMLQIVAMLVVYTIVLSGFARNFGAEVDAGVEIRFINERLIEQLTRAREAAEKSNEAKSRFLAVASHDLRQPLHAVTLLNGMLARPQPAARIEEISRQMARSLTTLERLFGSVLDFSRIEADKVRPLVGWHPLPPLMDQVANEYHAQAAAKGLTLQVAGIPVLLHTDAQLLERMLRNLVENALKFTDRGGVRVEALPQPDGGLVLAVTDSGPGIPGNLREHIFQEYYQTAGDKAAAGLGLGLAIVRGLAALLDLTVQVRDAQPQGACFEIAVPPARVRPWAGEDQAAADAAPEVDLRGYQVVYVDDDPSARQALAMLLEDWGCEAVVGASLEDAWRLLEGRPAPDAVLSDFSLQDGQTGVQVIEAMRQRFGPVAGAILTGEASALQRRLAGDLEYPVLGKPVTAGELRGLLEVFKGIG